MDDYRSWRRLVEVLGDLKPDVMHSHSSKAGILARKAAAAVGGMKIVHTVHGLPFHRYQSWWLNTAYIMLERQGARRSDALICVADAMTRQALAAGVGRPEQYTTIYSGMDTSVYLTPPPETQAFRASLNLPADAVLVTQVSRLAELKGHEFILEAARQLPDRRIHFCFVGDGRLRKQIEARVEELGLSGRFHLTGLLPPHQVPTVMHASDLVVHCSLREGLARAIPQAMLAGRPVISFDIDGASEVVDAGTGILLPPGDVAGLKRGIETLAASADLRRQLGQAGRERCRALFDHNRMVEQIERLYSSLIAKGGR